jgi:hypothetical protein
LGFMRGKFRILVDIKIEGSGVGVDGLNFARAGGSLSEGNPGKHHEQKTVCQFHCAVDDIWSRAWLAILVSAAARHFLFFSPILIRTIELLLVFNAIDSRPRAGVTFTQW